MSETTPTLSSRREFLFLYDIKMGNPNGDPDENRPRVLPDGTHYVTDVRLKRFVRDYLKSQGKEILVDSIEGKTTNLAGRVAHYLAQTKHKKIEDPREVVAILLDAFVDARLFGSSFAFKDQKAASGAEAPSADQTADSAQTSHESGADEGEPDDAASKKKGGKKKPVEKKGSKLVSGSAVIDGVKETVQWASPKTLTGAVQIQHGEVKHAAREVDIYGTSIFGSDVEKTQGTFTSYFGLRYALIAFHGVANEHSAKLSKMTDADYDALLKALWYGVRSAANTRTKRGQVPHLLLSVEYKPGEEFQFGRLSDYVKLSPRNDKDQPIDWASPEDYRIDLSTLIQRLKTQSSRIARIRYCISPDVEVVVGDGTEPWTTQLSPAAADLALDAPPMEPSA